MFLHLHSSLEHACFPESGQKDNVLMKPIIHSRKKSLHSSAMTPIDFLCQFDKQQFALFVKWSALNVAFPKMCFDTLCIRQTMQTDHIFAFCSMLLIVSKVLTFKIANQCGHLVPRCATSCAFPKMHQLILLGNWICSAPIMKEQPLSGFAATNSAAWFWFHLAACVENKILFHTFNFDY